MKQIIYLGIALLFTVTSFSSFAGTGVGDGDEVIITNSFQTASESTKMSKKELRKLKRAERKELRKQKRAQRKAIKKQMKEQGGKSQLVALLLVIFLGGLGIHRFYLGHTGIGILMLLTGGVFGILWLIDLIRIITGDLKPKDGDYAETL